MIWFHLAKCSMAIHSSNKCRNNK